MSKDQAARNRRAAVCMLFAILLFSLTPLLFHIGDAGSAVFYFSSVMNGAAVIPIVFFLRYHGKKHGLFQTQWVKVSRANLFRPALWLIFIGVFAHTVFAWSLNYVDISVAAILFEIWPIFLMLLTGWLFREQKRYQKMRVGAWLLVIVSFCGLVLVIFSQIEKGEGFFSFDASEASMIGVGVVLVLLAAVLTAMPTPFSLIWGNRVAQEATKTAGVNEEIFFTVVALMIVRFGGCVFIAFLGLVWGEKLTTDGFIAALLIGVAMSSGGILLRYANTLTDNLGLNVLIYATPILSLIWLFGGGYASVPQVDYFVIGCIAILMANILINFEANVRLGYRALVVSLWACGMVVYFPWTGVQFTEYYNAITVAATIFILILSFRTDRMIRRDSGEDDLVFSIWRLISAVLVDEKRIERARAALLRLATATSKTRLKRAHPVLMNLVTSSPDGYSKKTASYLAKEEAEMMVEASKQIDMLAHSKQQGRNFAEIISLGILAAITVWGLLFFAPPNMTGHAGFYANMSSFLLASTIIFLLFNVYDLQKDREHAPMLKDGKINFQGTEDRKFEHRLSIVACGTVIFVYGLLFWYQ